MRILIVDDEKLARLNIRRQLDESFEVVEADSYLKAADLLENSLFDICFVDLNLDASDELKGLKLVLLSNKKGIYTVVMSSHDEDEIIEEAYKLGCRDYYSKGNEVSNVNETLNKYFLTKDLFNEENLFENIFPTNNEHQKSLIKKLIPIISTEIPVCLLGESGTGKSHLARNIHKLSRRKGEFIEINCAALSEDLLEAELFGHAKGAFTGASDKHHGKLALADNGTLFLDEIGSMSPGMQTKLLKAIEEKSYYSVNSDKKIKSNFRIISATLDDIEGLLKSGKFRFDLFQRICGLSVTLLPLSKRKEDILPLLKNKISLSRRIVFASEAKKIIEDYSWPGNIRELLRFAEIIAQTGSGLITADHVKSFVENSTLTQNKSFVNDEILNFVTKNGLSKFIELFEQEIVEKTLQINNKNVRKTIADLRVSTSRYYRISNGKAESFDLSSIEIAHAAQ